MYQVRIVPNNPNKKKCKCQERCAVLVQYVDMDGDVVRTVCAVEAKKHAFDILNQLITSSANVLAAQRSLKSYRNWKTDEKTLVELYNGGYSHGIIAIKLGRTYKSVNQKIKFMITNGKLAPRSTKIESDVL